MRQPLTIIALGLVLLGTSLRGFEQYKPRLVVLDVGQGDALYLRTPAGQDILIDGGPGAAVVDALRQELPSGDRDLELVIATHLDADHIGGLDDVFDAYTVRQFAYNGVAPHTKTGTQLLEKIASAGLTAQTLARGTWLAGGSLQVQTLWPPVDYQQNPKYQSLESNELGVVLLVHSPNNSALLMADVPDRVESELIASQDSLDVETLKVGHHGSKTSTSDALLVATTPRRAIISVGRSNKYGHPTPEALARLEAHGVEVLRTDQAGAQTVLLY